LLATDVWTGVDSASWSDGGNWSRGAPPGTSDVADFTNSGSGSSLLSATLDGSTTISGLLIDGTWNGTVTLEAPLTLTGTSQLSSGTIDFSEDTSGSVPVLGSLSNSGTLTISGSNLLQWSAADTISNSGTLDLSASATFALASGATLANSGTIDDQLGGSGFSIDAATLNNEPAGTFDFQADSTISFLSAAGTFENAGTLQKTAGTGVSVIDVNFDNQGGTIEVDSGTISLQSAGGTSSGGDFIVAAGAILDLTGGNTVAYAGSYHGSGAGAVSLDSGTLAVGTGGATFNFAGGLFQWSGGTIDTSLGNLTNSGTMTLSGAGGGSEHLEGTGILTNLGTIDQTGAATFDIDSPAALDNLPAGTYDLAADSGISEDQLGGTFVNSGTLEKTAGTGTSGIDGGIRFNDTGTVDAETGTLSVASTGQVISGGTLSGGTWEVGAGSTLDLAGRVTTLGATVDLNGPGASFPALNTLATIAAGGRLNINGGGSFTTTGNLASAGTLGLEPATLVVNGTYTQDSTGSLDVQAGGTTPGSQFGQLIVMSQATVAGGLQVTVNSGYAPALGQSLAIIPAGSVSGQFTSVSGVSRSGPVSLQVSYGAKSVSLTTVKSTSLTLGTSANPAAGGASVTFTVTVQPTPPGTGTPTGTVTFLDGTTTLGTPIMLSGGSATYTTSILALGTHSISVDYGGDPNFGSSSSTVLEQNIEDASMTTVVSSNNPASYGSMVTLTATVASAVSGAGTPAGNVTFMDGSTALETVPLLSGTATYSTTSFSVASQMITAVYGGDADFAGSPSKVLTQTVNQDSTTTTVSSSTNPSVFGGSTTLTALVQPAGSPPTPPTQNVTFYDGTTALGTVPLAGGMASLPITTLPGGTDLITAVYSGDPNFSSSPSNTVMQIVQQQGTHTFLRSSGGTTVFGQPVAFTVTVDPQVPGTGTPTGAVTLMNGASAVGSGTLTGGGVTIPVATLPAGVDSITAVYGSDQNFSSSPSLPVSQTVEQDGTESVVTSSGSPSAFGAPVIFTATVSAMPPGSGTPTGDVTFLDGSTPFFTTMLSGGTATYLSAALEGGTHSITVDYGGDPNFTISTSQVVSETIAQVGSNTAVSSSVGRSFYGQLVSFTATVTPASGLGTPTGIVTFMDGSATIGTAMLSGGSAVLTTNLLPLGSQTISAAFAGSASFAASASPGLGQTVIPTGTFTVLVPFSNPGFAGQPVTITAMVISDPPGIAAPVGSLIFKEGKKTLGRATLVNGKATLTTKKLALGANKIQVIYSGNADFMGNNSAILKEVIKKKPARTKRK